MSGSKVATYMAVAMFLWTPLSAQGPIPSPSDYFSKLVQTLKQEEGFRSKPYLDSRGVLTIGFGTDLDEGITKAEGEYLLRERLRSAMERLRMAWEPFSRQPPRIQSALLDMAYNLGTEGLLKFHDMLAALEAGSLREGQRSRSGLSVGTPGSNSR